MQQNGHRIYKQTAHKNRQLKPVKLERNIYRMSTHIPTTMKLSIESLASLTALSLEISQPLHYRSLLCGHHHNMEHLGAKDSLIDN